MTRAEPAVEGDVALLMGRYCDGDAAAFSQLYQQLAPRILGYLVGIIGDRAAAEDILQLTFLKVHEARSSYVRGADPVPWLYTIAHRTCLDELRRRKRSRIQVSADGSAPPDLRADLRGHGEGVADDPPSEDAVRALKALDTLPETQRQAVLLTTVHGRSHAEAASIMGTTPGAIKLRVHRGYEALRVLLRSKEAP